MSNSVPAFSNRPALADADAQSAADTAVAAFVAELQAGWDRRDAAITDRHVAADVAWGSPYGATVDGYDALHAIHIRLKKQGAGGGASRFEVQRALALSDDVVIAQVARRALDAEGRPLEPTSDPTAAFSEMALYVLVRRNGEWWLAAGQNTPIRPGGAV